MMYTLPLKAAVAEPARLSGKLAPLLQMLVMAS